MDLTRLCSQFHLVVRSRPVFGYNYTGEVIGDVSLVPDGVTAVRQEIPGITKSETPEDAIRPLNY